MRDRAGDAERGGKLRSLRFECGGVIGFIAACVEFHRIERVVSAAHFLRGDVDRAARRLDVFHVGDDDGVLDVQVAGGDFRAGEIRLRVEVGPFALGRNRTAQAAVGLRHPVIEIGDGELGGDVGLIRRFSFHTDRAVAGFDVERAVHRQRRGEGQIRASAEWTLAQRAGKFVDPDHAGRPIFLHFSICG